MVENLEKISMDKPVTYEVKVPGEIGEPWSDWDESMEIITERSAEGSPNTIFLLKVDQAALIGFLRRLNTMGLPLISVRWAGED